MVRRFVGAPWIVSIAPPSSPVLDLDLEGLEKATARPGRRVREGGERRLVRQGLGRPRRSTRCRAAGVVFTGREYDTATRRLGPLQRRHGRGPRRRPAPCCEFTLDLFSPTALISGEEGGQALLTVRGSRHRAGQPDRQASSRAGHGVPALAADLGARTARSSCGSSRGPISGSSRWTGPVARCAIISGLNDPLSKRFIQPNTLAAVGIKPGNSPLRLRFVTFKDKTPGAGYTLTARPVPNGTTRELGMTDRGGRIVLKPGFADGLVILRLLAGNVEPVREFPIMPGESSEERTIPFDPKYQCVALEAEVDSLRDEVVDLIALRARLEARMKARLEGEDWEGLEEAVKEFDRLTPRDEYAKQLAELKERAAQQQAETKVAILTKTAQAQINDLQAMIDRYLDDEAIKAYREAHRTRPDRDRREGEGHARAAASKAAAAKEAAQAASKAATARRRPSRRGPASAATGRTAQGQGKPAPREPRVAFRVGPTPCRG